MEYYLLLTHPMRERTQTNSISIPRLEETSLRPASVFNITEAKIDELGFGTLIDCIETG